MRQTHGLCSIGGFQISERRCIFGRMHSKVTLEAWGFTKVTLARLNSTRNRKGGDICRIGVRQTHGLCSIAIKMIELDQCTHKLTRSYSCKGDSTGPAALRLLAG